MSSPVAVAGRTDQEVGGLLEELVTEFLGRLGFGDFVRNAYKTGAEIDVRGAHRVTGAPILAECKARAAPVNAPALRLFHSELTKLRAKDGRAHGLFVSTSGVTGTAREWYDELDPDARRAFTVIEPPALIARLADVQMIMPRDAVLALLRERHAVAQAVDCLLVISRHGLVWVATTEHDKRKVGRITVIDASGTPTVAWKAREILRLLGRPYSAMQFFGLDVRRNVQLALLKAEGLRASEIAKSIKESAADVSGALQALNTRGVLEIKAGRATWARDVVPFVTVAAEFLRTDDAVVFLRSSFAKDMTRSDALLGYIDERYRLGLTPEDRDALGRVIGISPSALAYALFADAERFRTTHAHIQRVLKGEERDNWLRQHAATLPREAFFEAVHDFTSHDIQLAGLLGDLDVKRVRVRARLDLVGGPSWPKLSIHTESNVAIEKAGGKLEAGALVSFSEPAGFKAWDGMFHLEMEEWPEAEADFREGLSRVTPTTPRDLHQALLNNLGLVFLRQRRWQDAIPWFQQCLAVGSPEWPTPFTNLIFCLLESGDVAEAKAIAKKAIAAFPTLETDEIIIRCARHGQSPDAA